MFTGIIEEKGKLESIRLKGISGIINISAEAVLEGTKIGDSIAVNGVCLTVVEIRSGGFSADVMAETVRKTNLSALKAGDYVNLERAMAMNGRFGGHIVSGHIDATGRIIKMHKEEIGTWIYIEPDKDIDKNIVDEGSIAIDGISLTVAKTEEGRFAVSVIPHTGRETTLLDKKIGDIVNLETDIIGKYVEKLLKSEEREKGGNEKSRINMDFLAENGFI